MMKITFQAAMLVEKPCRGRQKKRKGTMGMQAIKAAVVIRKRPTEAFLPYPLIKLATALVEQMLYLRHELPTVSVAQYGSHPCRCLLIQPAFHLMHEIRRVTVDERWCFISIGQTMQEGCLFRRKQVAHWC